MPSAPPPAPALNEGTYWYLEARVLPVGRLELPFQNASCKPCGMHPYSTLTTTARTFLEARTPPILGVVKRRVRLPGEPRPERRANVRFPLNLEVRSVSHRRKSMETRFPPCQYS